MAYRLQHCKNAITQLTDVNLGILGNSNMSDSINGDTGASLLVLILLSGPKTTNRNQESNPGTLSFSCFWHLAISLHRKQ